jgi:hypothetical protein
VSLEEENGSVEEKDGKKGKRNKTESKEGRREGRKEGDKKGGRGREK